jgi:hypothetical protein
MRHPEYWDWVLAAADAADQDPYALASSFYGPGIVFCWYMIALSVFFKLTDDARRCPGRSLRLSPDLVTLLLYPAIAAGHLLVRLAEFPPAERRRLVEILLDLALAAGAPKNPHFVSWLGGAGAPSVAAFQHGVSVEGPARVVQNFVFVVLTALFLDAVHRGDRGWVTRLVFAVFWWCCLLLAVLLAVGSSFASVCLYVLLATGGQTTSCLLLMFVFALGFAMPVRVYPVFRELRSVFHRVFLALAVVVVGIIPLICFVRLLPVVLSATIVPDAGVGFGDLDQVATAVAGFMTFGMTLWSTTGIRPQIVGRWKTWWKAARGYVSRGSAEDLPLYSTAEVTGGGHLGRAYIL